MNSVIEEDDKNKQRNYTMKNCSSARRSVNKENVNSIQGKYPLQSAFM